MAALSHHRLGRSAMPSTEAMRSTEAMGSTELQSEDRQGAGRVDLRGCRPGRHGAHAAIEARGMGIAHDRHPLIALAPRDGHRILPEGAADAAADGLGADEEMAEADARRVRLEAVESEDEPALALGQAEDMAADHGGLDGEGRAAAGH